MRAGAFYIIISVGSAIGCGDPPICQQAAFVAFGQTQITRDLDDAAPGVQTDVTLRTSLQVGEEVELTVRDASGVTLATLREAVDAAGGVTFTHVSVPDGEVVLHAIARGLCGEASDEITVAVAGAGCALALVPAPEASAFSAPLAVLSTRSDPDPLTPGYQTTVQVTTRPGFAVEIFELAGTERALATITAGGDGVVALPVTVADGLVGFRATCAGTGNTLATPTTTVVADTTPPGCTLIAPAPGTAITPALDANHDLGDGIQLTMAGRGDGADLVGEPVRWTITDAGGEAVLAAPALDASGATSAMATFSPAVLASEVHVALTVQDHAGNLCMTTASYDLVSSDVTPPDAVDALTAQARDRRTIRLGWTAPADTGQPVARYLIKASAEPLTEATFDAAGTVIAAGPPGAPGTAEQLDVAPVRIAAPQFFAIAAVDNVGNRSAIAVAGPVTTELAQSGASLPSNANAGALALGFAIAHGRFNDDDFEDVALAAPTQDAGSKSGAGAVYVYFGGPTGLPATPDVTITGDVAGGQLGAGLTAVRWSSPTRDDLAIGQPGGDGAIFVLRNLAAGTRAATTAELRITAAATGWFAGSRLGSVLQTADVDGDGTPDLVASAPRGGGAGGVIILYGDTVTGDVVVSDDPATANGAVVERFDDPGATPGRQLGFYLHAVGKTEGPLDLTDDLVIAYADDPNAAGDSLYVVRGDGTRPAAAGVTARPFVRGRDVRLDYVTTSKPAEWGAQVTSTDDQNGDGARDLVISAYRVGNGRGQVLIVAGNALGTGGVARTSDPGVTLTTINPATNVTRLGSAIAARDAASHADLDADGLDDLVIAGEDGAIGAGFVWYGGTIPSGVTTTASASATLHAPSPLRFQRQTPQGLAGQARWVGDVDHDGLDDVCWASPFDNRGDGAFELLR